MNLCMGGSQPARPDLWGARGRGCGLLAGRPHPDSVAGPDQKSSRPVGGTTGSLSAVLAQIGVWGGRFSAGPAGRSGHQRLACQSCHLVELLV